MRLTSFHISLKLIQLYLPSFRSIVIVQLSIPKLFLIICGSVVSMMEKLLGYKSPIYGRRTAQLRLEPLGFFQIRDFFI